MNKAKRAWCVTVLALAAAALAAETAQEIAREVDRRDAAGGSSMAFAMTIDSGDGSKPREYAITSLENDAGDSLLEFAEPRAVKGMRILSVGNGSWAFFPSTGRVRKIGGAARSGSVQGIGGDFSYDDLGGGALADDYRFTLASETDKEWVLDGARSNDDAAYDAVRITVLKDGYLMSRAEFSLASKGGFYKVLDLADFRDYGGRVRASSLTMRNLKSGSSTVVRLLEARFDLAVDPSRFDPARLAR